MADHVVPATPTAWEIKEMMIEWFMENNLESMMLTDLTDIDLSKVAAFHHNEVERIKSGTPFYAGPNLHTALEDNVLSCRRQEFLENNLPAFSIREDTEDSVRDLLDLDLQKFGYTTYIGKTTNWAAKAVVLATHRRKSHLGIPLHFERFQDDRRGEYDFEVLVVSLHNGHPNDRQTTKLFFKYATPYNEFNEALRVATQRSVIPPIDISELDRSFQDRIADAQPNALGIAMPSPSSDSPAGNSGTSHLPYEKKQAVRGYTIADGPWLYRIALGLKIISGREVRGVKIWNREILDAEAYFEMIRFVKKMTTGKAAGEKLTVLVKHSMDEKACKQWKLHLEEEAAEEERYVQELNTQAALHNEVYDFGEPYVAAEKKRLAAQQRIDRKQVWTNNHATQMSRKVHSELKASRMSSGDRNEVEEARIKMKYRRELDDKIEASMDEENFSRDLGDLWP